MFLSHHVWIFEDKKTNRTKVKAHVPIVGVAERAADFFAHKTTPMFAVLFVEFFFDEGGHLAVLDFAKVNDGQLGQIDRESLHVFGHFGSYDYGRVFFKC